MTSGASAPAWRRWLGDWLERRVVWVTDARRDLRGGVATGRAVVAVLGREHYAERRRHYPIRSLRDLDRVLAQEQRGDGTLTLVGPFVDDRREVTFVEPAPDAYARTGDALFVVPEAAVLAATLPAGSVAEVERDGFRYFLAASGESQPQLASIRTPALFAIAVGLDEAAAGLRVDRADGAERLRRGLRRVGAGTWWRLFRPRAAGAFELPWKSLALLAGGALVAYLAVASAYLALTYRARDAALAALGPEIQQLLAAQRDVEQLAAERQAVGTVVGQRRETVEVWRLVGIAWQKGARITQVQVTDANVTVRGNAPTATDVLAALQAQPGVADVRFAAPVRREGGREDFAIALVLASPRAAGAPPAAASANAAATAAGPPSPGAPAAGGGARG